LHRTIWAVTDWLAGRNGWLGMSLCEQTLEFTAEDLSAWVWAREIRLPRPPLIEVVSVTHVDPDGIETAVASAGYTTGIGSDGIPFVRMKAGAWPSAGYGEAARIRYRAGHVDGGIDEGLRQAIIMTVARLYENRGDGIAGDFREDPFIQEMFGSYHVFGL
jgi:uncharacterized phiE125 gp8 family phage protein